jgi:hypothetical protein
MLNKRVKAAICSVVLIFSTITSATAAPAVSIPTNVSAVGNRGGTYTNGTVTVKWSTVTGVDGYSVQTLLSGNQIGDLSSILGESSNELTVSGLQGGQEYSFKVRAVSLGAVSSWTTAVTATPFTAPAVPPKPTQSNENLTVTVRWSAPVSDGGSAITSYVVTEVNSGATTTKSATTFSAVFTNMTAGSTVKFNVKAVNEISSSGTVSANSDQLFLPNVPAQVSDVSTSTTSNKDELSVSWAIPADRGSAITGFIVYLRQSGSDIKEIAVADATSTNLVIQSLSAGQYKAQVLAKNIIGNGARSTESNQTTVEGVTPASTTPVSGGGGSGGGGSGGGGSGGGGSSSPTPTPTPSASPSPSSTKSPTPNPSSSGKPTPAPSTTTGKVLSKPTTFITTLPKSFTSTVASSKVVDAKGNTIKNVKVSFLKSGKVSAVFPKGTRPGTYSIKVTGKNKKTTTVKIVVK